MLNHVDASMPQATHPRPFPWPFADTHLPAHLSPQLFNRENIYRHPEGGGAGNNWACGYSIGATVQEEILEMIDREARPPIVMTMHSVL